MEKTERFGSYKFWIQFTARYLWYLFLLVMIIILFQGPDRGFRYLGL